MMIRSITIRQFAFIAGLVCILGALPAHAACSGSGTTWSCSSGSSSSDVQNALSSASDGAIITLASGSYSWSGAANFTSSKGATLICATVGSCTVSTSATILGMSSWSGTSSKLYRISGFVFDVSGSSTLPIWFGSGGGANGVLTQVRIDHNQFKLAPTDIAITFGENTSTVNIYGVVDHNTVTSSGSVQLLYMLGVVNPNPPSSPIGTANNMFVEDNTMTIQSMTDAGQGCMDGWGGDNIVWRHNTTTNCLVTSHGATHGGGPQNLELYNNTIIVNSGASGYSDCYRCFHHQGSGEFVAFNNAFTASSGKNGSALSMMDYRAYSNSIDGGEPICDGSVTSDLGDGHSDGNRSPTSSNYGYPCWHQPGRDFAGNLMPMYIWNNYWSDTRAKVAMNMEDLGGSPDYVPNHEQANRDYYNAVSASAQSSATAPFTGATGMGFGTLANRPTSCTTNTNESGGGVGYFATDAGAQGTLYRCSATNTWTVQYSPYTYPHPLVTGGTGSGPQPPTILQVTVL
jgi:hypothetical protein